ncbi:hypothetical protein [Gemmatimonas sp.]|uniref:hypothetical protein n=1 Tax=Gemmatimonas sp. TaxID=1962908 RepID=UPI003983AA83
MTSPSARAKGSAVQSTLAFLAATAGEEMPAQLMAELDADTRAAVIGATSTHELPYDVLVTLWLAADRWILQYRPVLRDWAEQAGEASIGSLGVHLYGGILRKPTPREFLTQSISLFRLYYQPGDMEVVEDVLGRAVLRLVGFDPVTTIFCRRQTGGLRQAVALAGGESARVRHVRCSIDGDAFCEWELSWQVESATAGARSTT